MTCETCRYWTPGQPNGDECRRRAPVATGGMHCPEYTMFPRTSAEMWCGEYAAKEQNDV